MPGWRKIVHRDIVPRNIFLKTNQVVLFLSSFSGTLGAPLSLNGRMTW